MKKQEPIKKMILSLYHYMCFFLLMAFLITCSMLLFLRTMTYSTGITLTESNVKTAAIVTFWNVVFLSLVCTLIDAFRRKITVDRPVKRIVDAAEQITKGNYAVRIPRLHSLNRADGLDKIIDCFNKMAEELSGVETLQTDFISNVSHELKTPISAMQNYAVLLTQKNITEEERIYYSNAIAEASHSLSTLVTNILKLSKLENQQIYPKKDHFNLTEQLCECLLRFESIWEEKGIAIETDLQEDVWIDADAELLTLVWNNLFSNALKFTDQGKVVVSLKAEMDVVSVSVADTGCGIPSNAGKRIFDKFYQADFSHATQGNGLGLALVKRVIDILQGEIEVKSQPNIGSTFTVKIRSCKNE